MNESSLSFHANLIDKNHIFDLTQNLPGTIITAKHGIFMRIHQIFSCKMEDCFDGFLINAYVFKKD